MDEGGTLATGEDLQGPIAQGRTVAETMEIAQDAARRPVESYSTDPHPAFPCGGRAVLKLPGPLLLLGAGASR